MIPLFRYPKKWGVPQTVTSVTTAVGLWAKLSPDALAWQTQGAQLTPRFERIMVADDTGPQFVRITDVVS